MSFRARGVLAAAAVASAAAFAAAAPAHAAFPGTNGQIAYAGPAMGDPDGVFDYDIWTVDPAGGSPPAIPLGEAHEGDVAFSPDGTRIAYVSGAGTDPSGCATGEIYVANVDGSEIDHVTDTLDVAVSDPAWSPDGGRLAYTRITPQQGQGDPCSSHDHDIWSMRPDGTGHVQLTSGYQGGFAGVDTDPAWSPDGDRIAFAGHRLNSAGDTVLRIRTMNTDGSNVTAITDPGDPPIIQPGNPSWSPDGEQIAFERNDPLGGWEIWRVNEDGTGETAVTDNGFVMNSEPAWSPDGTKIAFSAQDGCCIGFDVELYTIDAAGTGQEQITSDSTDNAAPDWQPLPAEQDLVVTDCSDPGLQSVTDVEGDLVVQNVVGCGELDLPSLVSVGGDLEISGNASATVINLAELVSVSGGIDITENSSATTINLGELADVGEGISIEDNSQSTVVNLAELGTVAGNLSIESAGIVIDLGGGDVAGEVDITSLGGDSVTATTGGGATGISFFGGRALMDVSLPAGAFSAPVDFTITRRGDDPPVAGSTATGEPAEIDPLAGYEFSFAVPQLDSQATLAFTIDLAEMDTATRAGLLAGVADGSATIAVQRDAPDAVPEAFARCGAGETPPADGCVSATVLGADGQPVGTGEPAFVRFDGVAGHFSTWSVALVGETDSPVDPPVDPPDPPIDPPADPPPPPAGPDDEACDRAKAALAKAKAKLKKLRKSAAKAKSASARTRVKRAKAAVKRARGAVGQAC